MPLSTWNKATTGSEVAKHFAAHIKGKNVLITGASPGGLGAEMARILAPYEPGLLVLAGRSQAKLDDCTRAIKQSNSQASVKTLILDLASLQQTREAAKEFLSWNVQLDVLCNNAGIMAVPKRTLTQDGFESQLHTNHIGHFLFTNLIKHRFKQGARIVNVSSHGHRNGSFRFDDPNFDKEDEYKPFVSYGQSKTANMLFSVGIANRWKDRQIVSISLMPGSIDTNLASNSMSKEDLAKIDLTNHIFKTLDEGTATQIVASFDPEMVNYNGSYLDDCQVADNDEGTKAYALSSDNAEKVWQWTNKVLCENFA
ncbi:hypothetical protein OIO90_001767 [Microbotryomycetes sp. JL221]|nr:hypothetical protein OIO90_001767 [Microbotryomycetes sp. JL221]